MFRRILVQIDPSRPLHQAPRFAAALAERTKAELVALYVVDENISSMMGGDLVRTMDMALEAVGAEALADFSKKVGRGVRFRKAIGYGDTAETIAKYVARHAVDLVVTGGFHASVYSRIPFGSIVNEIIRKTPASLFLYRDSHADPMRPGPVVVPYDGSLPARRSLHVAADMARGFQQSLDIAYLHRPQGRQRAQSALNEVEEQASRLGLPFDTHPVKRLLMGGGVGALLKHAKRSESPYMAVPRTAAHNNFSGLNPLVERLVVRIDRPLLVIHA